MEARLSATDTPPSPPVRRIDRPARSYASLRSIIALMLREMTTRYGRTPGGYIWAIAEPVGALVVMAVAFSFMLRAPSLGNSFILFYASGYLPFTLFSTISTQVQNSLSFSRPLLQYPAVSWIDAIIAKFLLNFLTGVAVFAIVFTGILQFTEATATLDFGPIVTAILLSALVGLGVGSLNCLLDGMFPAWGNLWSIVTRPLFLIAGIFFTYDDMPPVAQDILWYTPWIHITGICRSGIYPTYSADYASIPLVMAWALIPMFFGLLLLRRFYQDILNR